MGLYRIGATASAIVQESASRTDTLRTKAGVWTINKARGTVAFVAHPNFEGRDRVGFSVATKLGVKHETILTVKVTKPQSALPVAGGDVANSLYPAIWMVLVGLFLCGFVRARSRR